MIELAVQPQQIMSYFTDLAPTLALQIDAEVIGGLPEPAGTHALQAADQSLVVLGLAAGVAAFIWWLTQAGRDPLLAVPPRANRLREDSVFLAVLVYLTGVLAVSGVIQLIAGPGAEELTGGTAGSVAQLAGIVACLWIAAKTFDGGAQRFCFGQPGALLAKLAWTTGGTLAALGLCPLILQATILIVRLFNPAHEFGSHSVLEALRDAGQPTGIVVALWLGAALIAPVAEELFFRGILQTCLVNVFSQRWPASQHRWMALLAASAVFGFAHLGQPHAIPALVFLAFLFGFVYERTGALWPPIAMHSAFNLKSLIWEAAVMP